MLKYHQEQREAAIDLSPDFLFCWLIHNDKSHMQTMVDQPTARVYVDLLEGNI